METGAIFNFSSEDVELRRGACVISPVVRPTLRDNLVVYKEMNPSTKAFRSNPPVLTLLPAIHRDTFSDTYVEGPDGDLYFRTLAPDSPCREYWEGGDFVFQLTTHDRKRWLARSGVIAPKRQDWVAVA